MKTIFRLTCGSLFTAAALTLVTLSVSAQDPCAERASLEKTIRDQLPKKTLEDRRAVIVAGKQYLDPKFDSCPDDAGFGAWLKTNIPIFADTVRDMEFQKLLARFDEGMKAKNWDEVYAAGKLILEQKPNDYNDVKIVLGSIGLVETSKDTHVTKWNDDTLKYAQQAISDMEANKSFKKYGVAVKDGASFIYADKQNALGWMNYAIGYIYIHDKKDKKQGVSYLYRASQLTSETRSFPNIYDTIGGFYFDQATALEAEIAELSKSPGETPPDVVKQKSDAIKAKTATLNGTIEAAIDAYSRAYSLAKDNSKYSKTYIDGLYKKVNDLYNARFGKSEGVEAWMAEAKKKPLRDPSLPVTPVTDPEPATVAKTVPPATVAGTTGTAASAAKPVVKTPVVKKKRH